MALAPVILDDLDFKTMVEAIRRRIPAASDGVWTLHAPVDPGVTLLELFAWQLEQRLYRMDQVPQALSRSLLALMDARPLPTQCAQTVLELQGDANKTRLKAVGEEARSRGIFGAPTFFTEDGEMFWGNDRLDQAIGWASGETQLRTGSR